MHSALLWLPLKRFISSEGFFGVFSLFGLLCSLGVFARLGCSSW
jgi:hypothetical protein